MRVVLDTNAFIDAYICGDEVCRNILRQAYQDAILVLVSDSIVGEIAHTLWKKADDDRFSNEKLSEMFRMFATQMSWSESVDIKTKGSYCIDDPSDDKFVHCAIDGNAKYIISNDRHLLSVEKVIKNKKGEIVSVMRPNEFLVHLLVAKTNKKRN